jgi:hypothetical protein
VGVIGLEPLDDLIQDGGSSRKWVKTGVDVVLLVIVEGGCRAIRLSKKAQFIALPQSSGIMWK